MLGDKGWDPLGWKVGEHRFAMTEANYGNFIQRAIRAFLKVRTSYDVLPLSFRLIVFDTALLVKKSLNTLLHNGEFQLQRPSEEQEPRWANL